MSAFLTFDSLAVSAPDGRSLFDHLTISIGAERVGLVGRNGSGKSTLLRIAMGDLLPRSGHVARRGRAAMLRQDWTGYWSVANALGVAPALAVVNRVMAGQGSEADWEAVDWTLDGRIAEALVQVGLADIPLDAMMARFSGGERTRIGIAHLLIEAPDLLLLDEPSNNLDNAGRDALLRLIRNWSGGILVASHDRQLLEIMDRIVEITPVGVRLFSGGWSAFVEARDAERARFVADQERSEMQLRAARRHVQAQQEAKARRDSGGRADADRGSQPRILLGKRAQQAEESGARLRRAGEQQLAAASAALDESRQRLEIVTPLVMDVPPSAIPTGAAVLRLDGVIQALGARPLGPWTLHLRGPERVAVTGPNGAGKTSLLRIAYGSMPPGEGLARRAEGRVAMLDQHVALIDPTLSVVDNYRRLHPAADLQHAYAACARFAFRNDDARRVAGTLSGGERLRAGLACTLGAPVAPWLMLLDEPTNHLDLDSVAVLEGALNRYDGALLVVSHDREFLRAISIQREFHVDK